MAKSVARCLSTAASVGLLLACTQPRASAVPEPAPTRQGTQARPDRSGAAPLRPAARSAKAAESLDPGEHEVVLHALACPDGKVRAAVVVGGQEGESQRFGLGRYTKCPRTGHSKLRIELGCTSAEFHHGPSEPGGAVPMMEHTALTEIRVTVVEDNLVLHTRTERPWMRPGYNVEETRKVLMTLAEPNRVQLLKPIREQSAAPCED